MSRTSAGALISLAESMSPREREIVEAIAQLRLVAGSQLERLCFSEIVKSASRARVARRVLAGLVEARLLFRLRRRIGGVRAGSAGYVYGLGSVGKRLVSYWHGEGLQRVRAPHEPEAIAVRHTLGVAEHYVGLVEAQRQGRCDLLTFEGEPACWRSYIGLGGQSLTLKPDAFVRLGVGEFEERAFLEVDCGSEGRGALLRKCQRYVDYFNAGTEQANHGVFPRVVWSTTTQARVGLLSDVCASLPAEYWRLFGVGTPERALLLLSGKAGGHKKSVYKRISQAYNGG
jgi:hypothetical protein